MGEKEIENNIDIEENITNAIEIGKEIIEDISKRNDGCELTREEWLAYYMQDVEKLLDLYKQEKENYKRLSIEAQATAFDDMNKDTEMLLRVLLKQGEITLDEKGCYQRQDFAWEENLTQMGLMKKREKSFYIPDDNLDEYTKQLENQLQEYNELKEMFKKYCVFDNETIYDGCCKMQDEIDKLKEENKELKEKEKNLLVQLKDSEKELLEVTQNISKDKEPLLEERN